jgi:hypothetical protein
VRILASFVAVSAVLAVVAAGCGSETSPEETWAAVQEESEKLKEGFDKADSCEQFR